MIHPDTCLEFISETVGVGVVATKPIAKGTITWVSDKLDRRFTVEELETLGPLYAETMKTYAYRDRNGKYVFCWDNGRFVNHSFTANCLTTGYDFEIAIRDIAAGEELTDDYGYLNIDEPFTPLPEPGCERTVVYPDDLLRFHKEWDVLLQGAFEKLLDVDQPLQSLVSKEMWSEATNVSRGTAKMQSILNCYYRRPEG